MKRFRFRHVKIRVYGNVQGVFYRVFVKKHADELEIGGFTKNNSDGTVEIVAEGDEESMEEFIRRCRRGNEQSIIKRMRIVDGEMQGFNGFRVK